MSARVEETRFRGESGAVLRTGDLAATFLPGVGMTGVSLRSRGSEHLAVPGGIAALKRGGTGGLPLLAPWANRLSSRRYRVSGTNVDLSGRAIPTDGNGLPIHGLLLGSSGWSIDRTSARGEAASLSASIEVDTPAFPFPHRIEVIARARPDRIDVTTTLVPTGRRRVPVAFGWHPYLRLPDSRRRTWTLRLPSRRHLRLDERGIPTGGETREDADAQPIARRTFDDLYALGQIKRVALESATSTIELRCGPGYDYAQVWVPPRRPYAALEPMVAPTNALVDGAAPLVRPGDRYTARFSLVIGSPQNRTFREAGSSALP